MSTETQKLWSRRETSRQIDQAIRAMEQAEKHYAHLPERLKRQIENETGRLMALRARIETWPVTIDERARARMQRFAEKARR